VRAASAAQPMLLKYGLDHDQTRRTGSLGIPVAVNFSAEVVLVSIKGIIILRNVRHCGNMFSVFDIPLSRRQDRQQSLAMP
jgi:hypothetical protein